MEPKEYVVIDMHFSDGSPDDPIVVDVNDVNEIRRLQDSGLHKHKVYRGEGADAVAVREIWVDSSKEALS